MMRSIVDIMISFQYFSHLFLLMCDLPTTGIWIDGLWCHFIIILLSSIPTSCTPQVIQYLVLVCLPNPVNATFNLRPHRIPENYVIPRFIFRVVHFKADVTNNLSTSVAFIKVYENSCTGEIVLVAGILPIIGNILQCIHILLLDARFLPLGKHLGTLNLMGNAYADRVIYLYVASLMLYLRSDTPTAHLNSEIRTSNSKLNVPIYFPRGKQRA